MSNGDLIAVRNSAAILAAYAVKKIFPDARIGENRLNDHGFSFDFRNTQQVKESDLKLIQDTYLEAVKADKPFHARSVPKAEAVALFHQRLEIYQATLVEKLEQDEVSLVEVDGYLDIAPDQLVKSTRKLKNAEFLSIAGAYWGGNAANDAMQRIQAAVFSGKQELADHLTWLEEVKERDHRRLGEKLELFASMSFSPGSPVLLPKGMIVFEEMSRFIRDTFVANDYQQVRGPILCHQSLWEQSGHWEFYKDDMFLIEGEKGDQLGLKPMNCPVHMRLFGMKTRSYRELPYRLHDQSPLHRNEASGALSGMTRLRMFCQDDTHIFVQPEEIQNEISKILRLVDHVYTSFGMDYKIKLSTKPDDALGTQEEWDLAEGALVEALEKNGKAYEIKDKDGAFYGPKIDFDVRDALGREWQVATAQLDFQMPKRFALEYTDKDGAKKQPVVIHNAVFGAIERFMAIAIESYNGRFPPWLSPVQVKVLPVSDQYLDWANKIKRDFRAAGLRAELDTSGERLGKMIAQSQDSRIPVVAIVGGKETENSGVTLRFNYEAGNDNAGKQGIVTINDAVRQLSEYTQRPAIIAL